MKILWGCDKEITRIFCEKCLLEMKKRPRIGIFDILEASKSKIFSGGAPEPPLFFIF